MEQVYIFQPKTLLKLSASSLWRTARGSTLVITATRAIRSADLCAYLLGAGAQTGHPVAVVVVGSLAAARAKELVFGAWANTILTRRANGLALVSALGIGAVE